MPAIVFIHGGGFKSGNKANSGCYGGITVYTELLASHGFFVVSIDYRLEGLVGEDHFPAATEDSKCAVRWLRANADKYNIDPERIGVWGTSAGANLAMMVGLVDEMAGMEGNGGWEEFSSRVQAVVSYCGNADFIRSYEEREARFAARGLPYPDTGPNVIRFGGHLDEVPEIYKAGSPINHVTEDDPPLLLAHGELDTKIAYDRSEEIYQAYLEAGLEAELIKVSNAGHSFSQETDSPISPSFDDIYEMTLDFLIKHLLLNR
ncbi:alpha/beta fold hydrolase [Chloroflexota bacterium]